MMSVLVDDSENVFSWGRWARRSRRWFLCGLRFRLAEFLAAMETGKRAYPRFNVLRELTITAGQVHLR